MKLRAFLELVEIRTKTASILPYLVGTLYAVYQFQEFNTVNAILMLVSLLCIDLAVTALNNLLENMTAHSMFVHAGRKYSKATAQLLIVILLILAIVTGGILGTRTGPITWFIGISAFFIGLTYSAGPLPIQRTPCGELISGAVMGFGIVFLAAHIQMGAEYFKAFLFGDQFTLDINLKQLSALFLLSLPLIGAVSNVMLANNISDMEADFKKRRFTLPVTIGLSDSLFIFSLNYIVTGVSIILAVVLKVLPLTALLMVFVYGLVMRNARRFSSAPDKKKTFPLAVMNLNLIGAGLVLVIGSAILMKL